MAQHKVTFDAPALTLGNADIELHVRGNGALVGTLKISRGNVDWLPRDKQKWFRMGWREFDKVMREHGRKLR